MRHASRRSFTVEVKSAGRRRGTVIPTRVAAPTAPAPFPNPPSDAEPSAPLPEKRRILPNLIVPEPAQPEPVPSAEGLPARRPRGRPRKPRPVPVEPVAERIETAKPVPPPVPQARVQPQMPAQAPRKAAKLPAPDLARGERWKRRLGRWSR